MDMRQLDTIAEKGSAEDVVNILKTYGRATLQDNFGRSYGTVAERMLTTIEGDKDKARQEQKRSAVIQYVTKTGMFAPNAAQKAGAAAQESATMVELRDMIRDLTGRVEGLEKEVAELKKGEEEPAPQSAPADEPPAAETPVTPPAAPKSWQPQTSDLWRKLR